MPDDEGWTGAEIKECCRKAYRLKLTLKESAEYIVPVSRSAADQVNALRQQASGKFISASYPGAYQFQESTPAPRAGRAFRGMEATSWPPESRLLAGAEELVVAELPLSDLRGNLGSLRPTRLSLSTIAAHASRSADSAAAMSFSIWPAAAAVHFSVKSPGIS